MRRVFIFLCIMILVYSVYDNFRSISYYLLTSLNVGLRQGVVVIDPGHGGEEPGAVNNLNGQAVLEKDLNLKLSLKIKDVLQEHNVPVYLTRERDESLAFWKRADVANEKQACLFVSIHINSNKSPEPNGIYAYYPEGAGVNGKKLSEVIGKNLNGLDIDYKGELPGTYTVLTKSKVPVTLLELGFLSNSSDLKYLLDESFQDRLAKKIADGIIYYKEISNEEAKA